MGIFKDTADFYDPNGKKQTTEKEKLNSLFSSIMQELHVDANKDGKLDNKEVKFEAGKLKGLVFDTNRQRLLSTMIVKHNNEWSSNRLLEFAKIIGLYKKEGLSETANSIEKRLKDLQITTKINQFDTNKPAYFIHPLAIVGGLKSNLSITEIRVRAFMRMLRVGEGTIGDKGYETLFGGKSFIKDFSKDYSDHPKIAMPFGKTSSTAAGAYQVMGYTWEDKHMISKKESYGIKTFGKRDQDLFCVILLKYKRKKAWNLLLQGKIKKALELSLKEGGGYAYEWASLPPGRYGQPSKKMAKALQLYNEYYNEEINGVTDLHVEYGFLKEIFND